MEIKGSAAEIADFVSVLKRPGQTERKNPDWAREARKVLLTFQTMALSEKLGEPEHLILGVLTGEYQSDKLARRICEQVEKDLKRVT